jgi:hypothetical protein
MKPRPIASVEPIFSESILSEGTAAGDRLPHHGSIALPSRRSACNTGASQGTDGLPALVDSSRRRAVPLPFLRGKRPRFHLPAKTQLAMLELPELRRAWLGRERSLKLECALTLVAAGMSQGQAARAMGLPAATLCNWLKQYRAGDSSPILPARLQSSRGHRRWCRASIWLRL